MISSFNDIYLLEVRNARRSALGRLNAISCEKNPCYPEFVVVESELPFYVRDLLDSHESTRMFKGLDRRSGLG